MPEKYNTRLKNLLNEGLEVPDGRNKDEVENVLLGFESGSEDVKNVLTSATVLHLDGEARDFLKDYINEIDHSMEFARSLYAEEGVESLQRRYRGLFSLTQELSTDLKRAVDDDSELESIATKLKDAHLLAEVDYEKEQLQRAGKNLEDLIERKEKLETLVNHFEELEEYIREKSLVEMMEHRKHVLELMLEHSEEASGKDSGPVRVYLPEKILEQIQDAAKNYVEEITGYFICRKDGKKWVVLRQIQSGVGDETSVGTDDERRKAVNELVDKYPGYRIVEFHTHSMGTIRKHGPTFGKNWSKQDIENFKSQGEGYIGMLITPTHVLIRSNGFNSEWDTVKSGNVDGFENLKDELDKDWAEIASSYSFSDLPELTPFKE